MDWFRLQADEYVSLPTDEQGIIRSQVFPGLWLPVPALLSGEMATVLSVLQAGLAATEHQEFMQKLNENMGNRKQICTEFFQKSNRSPIYNIFAKKRV